MSKPSIFLSLLAIASSLAFVPGARAQSCLPPSAGDSVMICTPQNNFSIDGPVELSASANVSGLTLMRVYDNNQPVYETPMPTFDTFLYVGSGMHEIVVVAYNGGGDGFQQSTHIEVTNGSAGQPCGLPQIDQTINVCSPMGGTTIGSPITISARARWDCCVISHIRVYMDNQDVFDKDGGVPSLFTELSLSPGSHNMVIIAWNNQGQFITSSKTFEVASASCTATGSVSFCFPANNDTVPSPVQVTVASAVNSMTLLRLYDNDQNVFETANTSFSTDLAVGEGLHHLVAVAYDALGNASVDERFIRVTTPGTQFPCGIPDSGRDINICAPAEFSTVASAVTISARARWDCCVISHIRVYMDNQDVFDADSQEWAYQQFTLASGGHYMVVIVWDNNGDFTAVSRTFFVQ